MTGENSEETSGSDHRDESVSFIEELFRGDADGREAVIRPRREDEGSGSSRSLEGEGRGR